MNDRIDTFMLIGVIVLAIFITGVQVGIAHGRHLEREDLGLPDRPPFWEVTSAD